MEEQELIKQKAYEREYIAAVEHMKEKPLIERQRFVAAVTKIYPRVFAFINGASIFSSGCIIGYQNYTQDPSMLKAASVIGLLCLWFLFSVGFTAWYTDEMEENYKRYVKGVLTTNNVVTSVLSIVFSASMSYYAVSELSLIATDKSEIISNEYNEKVFTLNKQYSQDTMRLNTEIADYYNRNQIHVNRTTTVLRSGSEGAYEALVMRKLDIGKQHHDKLKEISPELDKAKLMSTARSKDISIIIAVVFLIAELVSHISGIFYSDRQQKLADAATKKTPPPPAKKEASIGHSFEKSIPQKIDAILDSSSEPERIAFISSLKTHYELSGRLTENQLRRLDFTYNDEIS